MIYPWLNEPWTWQFCGWYSGFAGTAYSLANIAYNSNLVDITNNHWLIKRAYRSNLKQSKIIKLNKAILDDISQFGMAGGFIGSLVMTLVALGIFLIGNKPTNYISDNYGNINNADSYQEYYAKTVRNINISYIYNNGNSFLTSIQFIYDYNDIIIYGDTFDNQVNINSYAYVDDTFTLDSNDQINSVNLWLSNDTISGIQFNTINGIESNIFGRNIGEEIIIKPRDKYSGFLLQGYEPYLQYSNIAGNNIISGINFLFVHPVSQFESTKPLQYTMISVLIWWFLLELFTLFTMQKRRKPDIPSDQSIFTVSLKDFWLTLKEAKEYPEIIKFCLAWFFYSDALGTMATVAVLFGRIELGLTTIELGLILLEVELCAAFGGIFHLWLQKRLNWNCQEMIIYHLISYSILMIYVLIGIINVLPFGLKTKIEMWVFTFIYGLHFSSIQSYSRAISSNLIPLEKENKIFSLLAITDKGSSWIGPLLVSIISNILGLRYSVFYVLLFYIIGIYFICKINLDKGIKQSGRVKSSNNK